MKLIKIPYIWLMLLIFPFNALGGNDDDTDPLTNMADKIRQIEEAKKKAEEEQAGLKKEKADLEKQLKIAQAAYDKIQMELDKQNQNIKELEEKNNTFEAENKSVAGPLEERIKQQQNTIDSLNNILNNQQKSEEEEISKLTRNIEEGNSQKTDNLKKEIEKLQEINDAIITENSKLRADSERKEKHLEELKNFEKEYLANLSNTFDADWANRRYSDMDAENLKELKQMCDKYKDRNDKIKVSSKKFAALQDELNCINEANRLLNEPYNLLAVNACLNDLEKTMPTATSSHQKELTAAGNNLKDYRKGIEKFQAFIVSVDEAAKEFSNHSASYIGVKKIVESQGNNLKEVENNPWLSVKYKEYLRELEKNCKEPGAARDAIMGLKTK